jgi:hypothetical protein
MGDAHAETVAVHASAALAGAAAGSSATLAFLQSACGLTGRICLTQALRNVTCDACLLVLTQSSDEEVTHG